MVAARHEHTIRVRYADSDQMGFAHHAAYVIWLEEARIEWLRSIGHSYRQLESEGLLMPVTELTIRYRRSLRFDDVATMITTATVAGPTRLAFATSISCAGTPCADAEVTVAAVSREGRPQRLPPDIMLHATSGVSA